MNKLIRPKKLSAGSHIRVIAPSRSLSIISAETREIANQRLTDLGFTISFGTHVEEVDDFHSSSVNSRLADLHAAFADPSVDGILTVIGGFNSNQLLDQIDWSIIKNNPKVFCGYSDITVLNNAILAQTGLITFSGPHYSTFGQKLHFNFTLDYFQKAVMDGNAINIQPSQEWTDDPWFLNQDDRHPIANDGHWVIHEGEAKGTIIGGNLCSLNLLQGTPYLPSLENSILFLEDTASSAPVDFDRDLQSLIHLPQFAGVQGIVIGRFQNGSNMTQELLRLIINTKAALSKLPIIANVDFGHTDPRITIPIGGQAQINAHTLTIN